MGRRLRLYMLHESGLSEKFSPVPLLKSHLQNFRKCANSILRKMSHSAFATEESNKLELNALKSIVTCVETRNLEHKFTIDTLKKRILELENASPARKKIPASMKPSTKRTPHDNHPNPSPVKSVPTPTLQVRLGAHQWLNDVMLPNQFLEHGTPFLTVDHPSTMVNTTTVLLLLHRHRISLPRCKTLDGQK